MAPKCRYISVLDGAGYLEIRSVSLVHRAPPTARTERYCVVPASARERRNRHCRVGARALQNGLPAGEGPPDIGLPAIGSQAQEGTLAVR